MLAPKPFYFQLIAAVTIAACLASRGLAVAPDWITQYGTALGESTYTITRDEIGDIYTAGNVFIGKLDSDGVVQWQDYVEPDHTVTAFDIVADSHGSLFMAGYRNAAIAGLPDAVLRRYDSSGSLIWTKQVGSPRHDTGRGVVVDESGNVFFGGTTYGSLAGMNAKDN